MTRHTAYFLLCLALAWSSPAQADTGCDAPDSWAQRSVCNSAALRELDGQLLKLAASARARSQNPDAFDAEQAQWTADRRDACNTVRCLQTSYRSRMDELRLQITGGRPPLLSPGTYHRHPVAADGEPPAPALWIEVLEQDRYRLRLLSSGEHTRRPVEGEFTESVGSARFTAPGCAFELGFAPDVIALSNTAGELCDTDLEGSYLRTAAGD